MTDDKNAVAAECINDLRNELAGANDKIVHCINQLNDDQLNWRPFEPANSIANLILHLDGNMRQWIIAGATGRADSRHRPSEFSDRKRYTKADLLARLGEIVNESDTLIAGVSAEQLLARRRIQSFEMTALAAIIGSVTHFVGHSQEIIYITRLQLRDAYKFKFVPTTKEMGA